MAFGYGYGGYPAMGGYYAPPMPDQLAQLRGGYQPMTGQQTAQMTPTQQAPMPSAQQTQPVGNGPIWVNGEEGAKAYLVAPNNTVMLMDADACVFYLKSADGAGVPNLRVFDYIERTNAPKMPSEPTNAPDIKYVTADKFDQLAARCDELAAELEAIKTSKGKKPAKEEVANA